MAAAANSLPDPAIASPAVSSRGTPARVEGLLESIKEEVARAATREGPVPSPHPALSYYRADRPRGPMRVESSGVTVAVITDRQKSIRLADGGVLRYAPGSYLFVTREARYTSTIERATPRRPYLSFAIRLEPEVLTETLLAIDDTPDGLAGDDAGGDDAPGDAWTDRIDRPLAACLLRLLRSVHDPYERRVLTPLAIREVVFRLLRSDAAGPLRRAARADDPRIRDAMRLVRRDPAAPLSVGSLARRVAMSPSHFAHRFREVARMSPMRFVKNVRLQQARLLMVQGGLRASEAALEVGYASPSHFTRDFKSHYGASPAAYARELRDRYSP